MGALLVLACSATKRPVADNVRLPFADLYDGPLWRDVRASGFPLARVAAISALYGFMPPGFLVYTYDREMDADASYRHAHTGNGAMQLAQLMTHASATLVVGGEQYKYIARIAEKILPENIGSVTYAAGSFLQQRKALNSWLRERTRPQAELFA